MIKVAIRYLFGCRHHNQSRIFTIKKRSYVVCLECGFRQTIDLGTMKRGPWFGPLDKERKKRDSHTEELVLTKIPN